MDSVFAGNAVKLYVFQQMLFHNGDCFSCRKGTDHGSDATPEIGGGAAGRSAVWCQTAEVESCLYILYFLRISPESSLGKRSVGTIGSIQ